MSSEIVIDVERVSKRFLIGHESVVRGQDSFRAVVARNARRLGRTVIEMSRGHPIVQGDEVEEFWALKDVSFKIMRGEVVGVVGRNGSGKSTLLKILSRITEPSEGRVAIRGRVASLLEVGTGFHPELSGRENIFLNGAVLGMGRNEIRAKFDEIVAFSGVERFLDTPVKRYSSGMYVRLAFAVAAHLDPEVLVVDEVLAVGDTEFQKKCLGKMSEVAGGGRTILFVSHNEMAVRSFCSKAIYLANGRLLSEGSTADVLDLYASERKPPTRDDLSHALQITPSLSLEHVELHPQEVVSGAISIHLTFRARQAGRLDACALVLFSPAGERVAVIDLREHTVVPHDFTPGYFTFKVKIVSAPLVEGRYPIELYVISETFAGLLPGLGELEILPRPIKNGVVPYPPNVMGLLLLEAAVELTGERQ